MVIFSNSVSMNSSIPIKCSENGSAIGILVQNQSRNFSLHGSLGDFLNLSSWLLCYDHIITLNRLDGFWSAHAIMWESESGRTNYRSYLLHIVCTWITSGKLLLNLMLAALSFCLPKFRRVQSCSIFATSLRPILIRAKDISRGYQ